MRLKFGWVNEPFLFSFPCDIMQIFLKICAERVMVQISSRQKLNLDTMKAFSVVTSISMVLTLTVALLSIIGIAITGLYPGIIVLWLLALVPIASRLYVTKRIRNSNDNHAKYYTTLTIINLLTILVVLWMTLVILHDRVLNDCC
jgi:predicted permease